MEKKILHINTGRGPAECAWVAAQVLKEILKEVRGTDIKAEVIHRIEGDMNKTILSASVMLEGTDLTDLISSWRGSILWIGKSPYRRFHKRKNWFVEVTTKDLNTKQALRYEDVKFTATKSSGPGGQHTNKTSSAVRATHQPTGLSVLVQDSRSQHQNRKIAFTRLQDLFSSHDRKELEQEEMNNWKEGITIQRGDAIRTFEGINFKRRK